MLRIRLTRVGKKGQPSYRIVVADAESKRDGRIVENIGHYSTLSKPSTFEIKEDRVLYWLSVGAQPSDTVLSFLEKRGTMKRLARLHAGEPLETLVAEVEGPKETAQPAPKKAAPARAPVAEKEAVVEMEAVEQPTAAAEAVAVQAGEALLADEAIAEESFAEEPLAAGPVGEETFAGETAVEEPAAEAGGDYPAVEPESVVEMETVEAEEEAGGLFDRVMGVVADAAEAVGDVAAGAAGAARDAVEDIFDDEEE